MAATYTKCYTWDVVVSGLEEIEEIRVAEIIRVRNTFKEKVRHLT